MYIFDLKEHTMKKHQFILRLFTLFVCIFLTSNILYGIDFETFKNKGSYTPKKYSDSVYTYDEEYFVKNKPAVIYYPEEVNGSSPACIFIHGWNGSYEGFIPIAEHLASHGTIVFLYSAIDMAKPFQWMDGLTAAYSMLITENKRPESPLYKKVKEDAIALIGHSMGGSGVLHTVASDAPLGLKGKIKTVIGLNPYNGGPPKTIDVVGGGNIELKANISALTVPVFIVTGSSDAVASPWKSYEFYTSFTSSAHNKKRVFFSLKGMEHTNWYGKGAKKELEDIVCTLTAAWLNAFLHGNEEACSFFSEMQGSIFDKEIKKLLATKPSPALPIPLPKEAEEYPAYKIEN